MVDQAAAGGSGIIVAATALQFFCEPAYAKGTPIHPFSGTTLVFRWMQCVYVSLYQWNIDSTERKGLLAFFFLVYSFEEYEAAINKQSSGQFFAVGKRDKCLHYQSASKPAIEAENPSVRTKKRADKI